MLIRPARPADRPRLLQIWLEASRVGHDFLGEDVLREQLPLLRDVYIPNADNWVAEQDGILGFIGLQGNHVGGLFVAPEAHRRGVGRSLVRHASDRLGPLSVEVYERNAAALAFYRGCGFEPVGRKALDDEGRPFALIRLRLSSGAAPSP
jgi:ribosomal protein S18 acetylase RimI-like enzyme